MVEVLYITECYHCGYSCLDDIKYPKCPQCGSEKIEHCEIDPEELEDL